MTMKDIPWPGVMPKCDACGLSDAGEYDVPTTMGPWGNLCKTCLPRFTTEGGRNIGFHRVAS